MPNKTATHASDKNSAAVSKPHRAARAARHKSEQVNPAKAFARAQGLPASELSARDILAIQRTAGNRAVEQMLAQRMQQHQQSRLTIQAKLAVGPPNDSYEREADRVAAEVMQTSEPSVSHIQRQASQEDEEEAIQTKPLASASITPLIQRQETPEKEDEEETLVQRRGVGSLPSVEPGVERGIASARSGGQSLPADLRTSMEQAFGSDFSGVRVHTGSESDNLNRSLQSRAFTTGHDVFFKRGEYNPASRRGQELIAHELTHVVQQNGSATRKRGLSVQRAPANLIQRSVEEDRMAWKRLSPKEKAGVLVAAPIAMPFVDMWESGTDAASSVYKYFAGNDPGRLRKFFSGAAAAIPFLLGSGYGMVKGVLRGAAYGVGNPLYSVGKRLVNFSLEETRGNYKQISSHPVYGGERKNYGYDTKTDLLNYGLQAVSTGASTGKFIADRTQVISQLPKPSSPADVWDNTKSFFSDSTPQASQAGQIMSWFGGVGGIGGSLGSLMEARKGFKEWGETASTKRQQRLGLSYGLSSTLSAAQQASTAAYHISNISGNNLAALGAQTASGGLAVATGAVDMLRGTYGFFKARQNVKRLNTLAGNEDLKEDTRKAVEQASSTQSTRKTASVVTGVKGALGVAGGALLAASTVTPIGWAILGVGALVGGIYALLKWWDKRQKKKAIAIKELGIEDDRREWLEEVEQVKKKYSWWSSEGRARRAALRPDPLKVALKDHGFKDAGHFYANYINKLANSLYDTAQADRNELLLAAANQRADATGKRPRDIVLPEKLKYPKDKSELEKAIKSEWASVPPGNNYLQISELIEAMGLRFKWKERPVQPTPSKIGKALDN
jgi:hypothetical protein